MNNSTRHVNEREETANEWMYNLVHWLAETVEPKMFWLENAPTIATRMGESVCNRLQHIAAGHKYSMHVLKLNALQFGMLQRQPRSFVSFWQNMGAPMLSKLAAKSWPYHDVATYLRGNVKDIGKPIGQHGLKASTIWAWIKSYSPDKYNDGKTGVVARVLHGKPFTRVLDYTFLVLARITSLQQFLQEVNEERYECLAAERKVLERLLDKGNKDPFSMQSCAWDDATPYCIGTASSTIT